MDLMSEYYKARELLLYTCAGTLATAKVYMQLPVHRRFVGCERDSAYFQDATSLLVEVHARQVMSPDANRAGSEKEFMASKML